MKKLGVLLAIGLVICGGLFAKLWWAAKAPTEVATRFVNHLRDNDIPSAFNMLHTTLREEHKSKQLAEMVDRLTRRAGRMNEPSWEGWNIETNLVGEATAELSGRAETTEGNEVEIEVKLAKVGDDWKIHEFLFSAHGENLVAGSDGEDGPSEHEGETPVDPTPAPSPQRYRNEFVATSADDLPAYLQRTVRVRTKKGVRRQGQLINVSRDRTTLRHRRYGGKFDFEVLLANIKEVEVLSQVY